MSNAAKAKRKFNLKVTSIIVIICAIIVWFSISFLFGDGKKIFDEPKQMVDVIENDSTITQVDKSFLDAVAPNVDTTIHIIKLSKPSTKVGYEIDNTAGYRVKRVFDGRRINIAVTGLDARIGTRSQHADANHVISIMPDKGIIEIVSVPRDTEAEAGFHDSLGFNRLTYVRANLGRKEYHNELARIAGFDRIHYWIEVGFSQVMGIMELLGIKDTKSSLQVLRSRRGLGGDDYQRTYNQAQFIRQMILRHFDKFTGTFGGLLVRGGLAIIETNLNSTEVNNIIAQLAENDFPKASSDITIKIRPPMNIQFKVFDFTDQEVFNSLKNKIESFNVSRSTDSTKYTSVNVNVVRRLQSAINKAVADSSRNPRTVIAGLETYFNQRAWFQVEDLNLRAKIRSDMSILLSDAYRKQKQNAQAEKVLEVVRNEEELFSKPIFNN